MNLSSAFSNGDLLQQIADRSLDVFFLYNLHTRRFEYVNEVFEEVWGRSKPRIHANIEQLLATIHPDDLPYLNKSYERLLTSAFRQSTEFRIKLANHSEKWINLTAYVLLQNGQRQCIAGFASDITHHKENEIVANKFSAHKNAMLEMMAHDLGGPLGIVQALSEKLESLGRETGLAAIEENATLIHQTIRKSIHLIHELLETEYLESSKTAIKKQRIELIEQVESLLAGFRRTDPNNHKQFELQSSSPRIVVHVDQTKFLQVISNLVSNAIKFTQDNGRIILRVEQRLQSILISVSDDGIGIPAHLQGVLFDRFTTARRPGLRGEETVGLGLSIVKRIVELHEGKVWCESQENKGSTFYIEIPTISEP